MTLEERNKLITDNLDLVSKNVNKLLKKSTVYIDEEELTNSLNLAFVMAANRFDPNKNVPFRRYIDSRLSYSAITYLRSIDHLTVLNRGRQKKIEKAKNVLSHQHHRVPTDEEVAKYLNIPIDVYRNMLVSLQKLSFYSVINTDNLDSPFDIIEDDTISSDMVTSNTGNPEDLFFVNELSHFVINQFCKTHKKIQLIYILYFVYNFSLKELSDLFNVTIIYASRVIASINKSISNETQTYLENIMEVYSGKNNGEWT